MSYRFEIDSERDLVHETWQGPVTLKDILSAFARRRAHPSWHPEIAGFIDLSDAELRLSTDDVHEIRARVERRGRSGPWAFVAPGDSTYGQIRQLQAVSEDLRPIGVFRSRPEACAWLEERLAG